MATFGTIAPVSDGRPPRHDAQTLCQVTKDGLAQVLAYDNVVWLCLGEREMPPLFKKMGR